MELNQDLPQSIDPDIIAEPGSLNNQEGNLELVANTRKNPDPSKGLPPEVIADLPNLNITFKSVTDSGEKLISLDEVEAQLLDDDGMSQASAETIERVVGNFYEQVGDQSKFSKTPTGIGMESTTTFLRNVRVELKRTMALEFQNLIEKPLACALEDMAMVKEKFEPYCSETCEGLRASMTSADRPFYESDNVIFVINGEFVNLFTTDLCRLVEIFEKSDNPDLIPFLANVKATHVILENSKLRAFIKCYNETKDFVKAISPQAKEYTDSGFTLKDLTDFFGHEDCCKAVADFTTLLSDKVQRFEEIRTEAVAAMEAGTMDQLVTLRSGEIRDFLKCVSHYFLFTNEYLLLLNQVKSLFDISQRTIEPTEVV